MFRLMVLVLALIIMTACVTRQASQDTLRSWYGADYEELVAAWGLPSSIKELEDGSRLAVWSDYYGPQPIGPPAFILLDNILPESLRRPRSVRETPEKYCKAQLFITPEGRVDYGIWSGDDCPAPPERSAS